MSTKTPLALPERIAIEIQVLSEAARSRGTYVSLREVVALTSTGTTVEQVRELWETTPGLSSKYTLESGLVLDHAGQQTRGHLAEFAIRQIRSADNVRLGARILSLCKRKHTRLASVSGSTAYGSVSNQDDLDFFCITRKGETWLFLARSLLMARIYRLIHRSSTRTCFSYVIDEEYAKMIFDKQRDALFARDALTAIVLEGSDYYRQLLRENDWISQYFPKLYREKISQAKTEGPPKYRTSPSMSLLNNLAFITVGSYIRLRSFMKNLSLRKHGMTHDRFIADIGRDHCIFESRRYCDLRELYRSLDEKDSTGLGR